LLDNLTVHFRRTELHWQLFCDLSLKYRWAKRYIHPAMPQIATLLLFYYNVTR